MKRRRVEALAGRQGFAAGDAVCVIPASMNRYGVYAERAWCQPRRCCRAPAGHERAGWRRDLNAAAHRLRRADRHHRSQGGRGSTDHRASSSVGLAAIEIANAVGATPIAVTRSGAKAAALKAAGAANVIASDTQDIAAETLRITAGRGARLAFDPIGGPIVDQLATALAPGGALIVYGNLSGQARNTVFPFAQSVMKGHHDARLPRVRVISNGATRARASSSSMASPLAASGRASPGPSRSSRSSTPTATSSRTSRSARSSLPSEPEDLSHWVESAHGALRRVAPAGIVILAAAAPLAAAQPSLDEVVIGSTRVQQRAFDVPAAVDSVRVVERPDALGINASEYLGAVAGLLVRDRQTYAQEQQISIRGFGARAQFGIVGLKLYVDGIPATMPDGQGQASHFNFDSAERFEILRGPFSVLYGNASGGVVQLFTAAGAGPASWRATLIGGAYDTWRASLNTRGEAHGIGYNLSYTRLRTDGPREHSAALRDSGNLRLDFQPREGNHLTLVANRLSSPYAYDAGALNRTQFDTDATLVAPAALQFDTRKSLGQTQVGIVDEQRIGAAQTLHVAAYAGSRRVTQFLSTSVIAQSSPLSSGGVVDLLNRFAGADARWTLALRWASGRSRWSWRGMGSAQSQRRGYRPYRHGLGVVGELRRDEENGCTTSTSTCRRAGT
jgi:NADPH:quinone reductase-like Zn-dependent oxidoreductase